MAMKIVGWIASLVLFVFLLGTLAVVCYYFPTLSSQLRAFERVIDCSDLRAEDYYGDYSIERNPKLLPPIKNISEILRTRVLKTSTPRIKLNLVTPSVKNKLTNKKNQSELIRKKTEGKINSTISTTHKTNININNKNKESFLHINNGPYFSPASPLNQEGLLQKNPAQFLTSPKTVDEHNNNNGDGVNKNSSKLNSISQSTANPDPANENSEKGKNIVLDMFESPGKVIRDRKTPPTHVPLNWMKLQSTLYQKPVTTRDPFL